MGKDRAQYLAAERHRTKVGRERKALAAIAAAAITAVVQVDQGRSPSEAIKDLKAAVLAGQREITR